uniref:Uncharacterized protein n=1 Tax=Oryza rufipogon TaxID=4529 RepID=A0A0E0PI72_ORYRU
MTPGYAWLIIARPPTTPQKRDSENNATTSRHKDAAISHILRKMWFSPKENLPRIKRGTLSGALRGNDTRRHSLCRPSDPLGDAFA